MSKVYNFNAGPAVLPAEVIKEAQAELIDFKGSGMSILESSHRAKEYAAVHEEAIANFRKLLNCSDDYSILFVAGGASMQFAMLPMNFLAPGKTADYVNSGQWAGKAIKEAKIIGSVNVAADCGNDIPTRMPNPGELKFTEGAVYAHITSNETISGAQMKTFPKAPAPLVADMSSDMLSRTFDVNDFALIYAGAQKNLGPSGIALVVARKDFVQNPPAGTPKFLQYKTYVENDSLFNTPPCFSIYIMMLVSRWMLKQGMSVIYERNVKKAAMIYSVIDNSGFYKGTAAMEFRSDMNVTFRLQTEALEKQFVDEASKKGLKGLKGHRSVGGIRASIYNAFPVEGVEALTEFMKDFENKNG
jgi:phosphoserine aminotransferase